MTRRHPVFINILPGDSMKHFLTAAATSLCLASGAFASTVGQPFLVIEDDLNGSILDFFFGGIPSGLQEVSVSGTVTEAIGAPALVGEAFSFSSSLNFGAEVSLGGTTGVFAEDFSEATGFTYLYDPFRQTGPGDINLALGLAPPSTVAYDPISDTFTETYLNEFAAFGPRTFGASDPGAGFLPVVMSVFLDAPLPQQLFEELDGAGNVISITPYIDGPLSISRITLGTVGGPAVPVPEVPLPASGLLILAAIGGLAAAGRKKA